MGYTYLTAKLPEEGSWVVHHRVHADGHSENLGYDEAPSSAAALEGGKLVAEHWRREAMRLGPGDGMAGIAHVCCMILAALDGERDPRNLGITPNSPEEKELLK